jgi:hypothetical protein
MRDNGGVKSAENGKDFSFLQLPLPIMTEIRIVHVLPMFYFSAVTGVSENNR